MTIRYLLFTLLCCGACIPAHGLAQFRDLPAYFETGLPFLQNYEPNDYGGAHAQNWAVLQDQRGVMYFANNLGVLEFDGVTWRLIPVTSGTTVRSLAMDENGAIYVGTRKGFGYLAPDSIGALRHVSLLEKIPAPYRDFPAIWQIFPARSGVYLQTRNYLLRWQPGPGQQTAIAARTAKPPPDGKVTVWPAQTEISRLGVFDDTVLLHQTGVGLMHLVNDSLRIAPDGEQLADITVRSIVAFPVQNPQGKPTFLLCTRTDGFFLYDMRTVRPFNVDSNMKVLLDTYGLYRCAALADSTIAISLTDAGVAVMDRFGRLQKRINRTAGLRNETIRFVYPDRQGGMWLALNNGVARVEYPAPLTYFNDRLGLRGNVSFIKKHQGTLYTGGNVAIHKLSAPQAAEGFPVFRRIIDDGLSGGGFISDGQTLLVTASEKIYHIVDDKALSFIELDARSMVRSRFRPDIAFTGLRQGLAVLKKIGNDWRLAGQVANVTTEVRSIVETAPGDLWLGNMYAGFSRVKIPDFDALVAESETEDIPAVVTDYSNSHGIPSGTGRVSLIADKVVFATNYGLRRFDEQRNLFLPDSAFGDRFADTTRMVSHLVEDASGNVWAKSTKDKIRETIKGSRGADGEYAWDDTPFRRIADWGSVYDLYLDPDISRVLWIGGPNGLLRYDGNVRKNYDVDFNCLVRKVIVNSDSTIFAGVPAADLPPPTLDYADNDLRFQFAATSYEVPSANRYQFFLEGFDEKWSGWTSETQKDYTNISEGIYTFRVRAKNIYDHLSSEDSYVFKMLPPWYRTWWAYAFYGLAVFVFFYSLRRYEMGRQQFKHNAELRAVEAEKLQEMDVLKSRFFANISHEFRTPLTLIMGQNESLLDEEDDVEKKSKLQMSQRHARQLLRLINQLLDLSKFEAGQATLRASPQNVVPLLRQLSGSFESLARQRGITLEFVCEAPEILLYFEQDKMEKIVQNLLSNALKFTPAGGRVLLKVEVAYQGKTDNSEKQGELKITVRDSGAGIPASQLPHIFDRFYQVDGSQTREFEGTGIGLALTQDLVQLHGGGISAESSEGFGTTFTVRLPLGKSHLQPEQIVEADGSGQEAGGRWLELDGSLRAAGGGGQFAVGSGQVADGTESVADENLQDLILIVEDNADMRSYIRENLENNFNILEAPNGEEGFAKAQEAVPDLIITDVMMPKVDGYELTKRIRLETATSHIPIIMLTARADEDDKFEGLEQGVDAYLTKPFNKKELGIRVRKLIEMRKQLRQQAGPAAILSPSVIKASSMDQQFLLRMREIIEENIENEDFSVDDLALKAGVGQRQLQRKIRALLDTSPQNCIRTMRLQRAKQLLEQNAGTVSEICFQVGYGNVNAFARAFREEFGASPSAVRKL